LNAFDGELKAIHMALVSAKGSDWNRVVILKALSNGKGPPDWRAMGSVLFTLLVLSLNLSLEYRTRLLIALQDVPVLLRALAPFVLGRHTLF
ncbi:hypothetical protein PanWU01x14_279780, partial [Parasponia andersonii]